MNNYVLNEVQYCSLVNFIKTVSGFFNQGLVIPASFISMQLLDSIEDIRKAFGLSENIPFQILPSALEAMTSLLYLPPEKEKDYKQKIVDKGMVCYQPKKFCVTEERNASILSTKNWTYMSLFESIARAGGGVRDFDKRIGEMSAMELLQILSANHIFFEYNRPEPFGTQGMQNEGTY